MNHDIAIRWADALTNGQYAHGFGALRRGQCWCPLGVLVDLYHHETGDGDWTTFGGFNLKDGGLYGATLPPKVRTWAEFIGEDNWWTPQLPERFHAGRMRSFADYGSVSIFIELNDGLNLTLAETAEIIRQQWELI